MNLVVKKLFGFLQLGVVAGPQAQQVRHKFVNWRMLKDFKKRKSFEKFGPERLRLNALRKNKILPPELQALADEEVAALPKTSNRSQLICRCSLTSRSRGTVKPYRISRIVFRHLADNNFLAGWKRAQW